MDILFINPAHIIRMSYTEPEEDKWWQVVMELSDGTKEVLDISNEKAFHEFINSFNFTRIK
jgi:hypothetical protein